MCMSYCYYQSHTVFHFCVILQYLQRHFPKLMHSGKITHFHDILGMVTICDQRLGIAVKCCVDFPWVVLKVISEMSVHLMINFHTMSNLFLWLEGIINYTKLLWVPILLWANSLYLLIAQTSVLYDISRFSTIWYDDLLHSHMSENTSLILKLL